MAFHQVPLVATVNQVAEQLVQADRALGDWRDADSLHTKVIHDTFRRRHLLPEFPALPVDVYVDDGRAGGYGSPGGQDRFDETLWLDDWRHPRGVWITKALYPDAAAQQAGSDADHVEPTAGHPAFLRVRVGNRGTTPSGRVTVRAFAAADPGLVRWPVDWSPMDVAVLSVDTVPPDGGGARPRGVVVGPFRWTPGAARGAVLVVVDSDEDRAVTQSLAPGIAVRAAALVPFDNNIALREFGSAPALDRTRRAPHPPRHATRGPVRLPGVLPPRARRLLTAPASGRTPRIPSTQWKSRGEGSP